MSFINEFVSEEDLKKFDLVEVTKKSLCGTQHLSWTVDRNREIYLQFIKSGREELADQYTFHMYWKGTLLQVVLDLLEVKGTSGSQGWLRWGMKSISAPFWSANTKEITDAVHQLLVEYQSEIINDLKEALLTYGSAGIDTRFSDTTVEFEF